MRPVTLAIVAVAVSVAGVLTPTVSNAQTDGITGSDWIFVQPEVGVAYADVLALSNNNLLPSLTESKVWGEQFAGVVGMRFGPFAFGVRGSFAHYNPFDIGTLGAEIQLRLPIPVIQPYARLGFGYAWLGAIDPETAWSCTSSAAASGGCPKIYGWTASAGAGVDIWLSRHFTVGAGLDVNILNLTRSASIDTVNYTQSGDSLGIEASLTAHAALRF